MRTEDSTTTETKIIELRRDHLTWREIAAQLGMSHEGCRKAYNRVLASYPAEALASMRIEESEAIDTARRHLKVLALKADSERNRIESWKVYIAASESKRKLFGLDAPIKREIEVIDSADASLRAEIAELEAEQRASEAYR